MTDPVQLDRLGDFVLKSSLQMSIKKTLKMGEEYRIP
jgi:hypothetical protein